MVNIILKNLGKGSYGNVNLISADNVILAEKEFIIHHENVGFDPYTLSEISNVTHLDNSENIIKFIKIDADKPSVYMKKYDKRLCTEEYSDAQIKKIMFQLCHAVYKTHVSGIIHRDIKPANILIDDDLNLVLIDFGISIYSAFTHAHCSDNVQTVNYRSPEILLRNKYDYAIDIWSLGCIFTELFTHVLLFPIKSEKRLAELILKTVETGSYTKKLKEIAKVECVLARKNLYDNKLICESAKNVILKMLVIAPNERFNIVEILRHSYFSEHTSLMMTDLYYNFDSHILNNLIENDKKRMKMMSVTYDEHHTSLYTLLSSVYYTEISYKKNFHSEIIQWAFFIVIDYLRLCKTINDDFDIDGITVAALVIASKLKNSYTTNIQWFLEKCKNVYSSNADNIKKIEMDLIKTLGFNFNYALPSHFMCAYRKKTGEQDIHLILMFSYLLLFNLDLRVYSVLQITYFSAYLSILHTYAPCIKKINRLNAFFNMDFDEKILYMIMVIDDYHFRPFMSFGIDVKNVIREYVIKTYPILLVE